MNGKEIKKLCTFLVYLKDFEEDNRKKRFQVTKELFMFDYAEAKEKGDNFVLSFPVFFSPQLSMQENSLSNFFSI